MARTTFWNVDEEGNSFEDYIDTPDEPTYTANDGNAGEQQSQDFLSRVLETTSQTTSQGVSSWVNSLFGGQSTEGYKGMDAAKYEPVQAQKSDDDSVISRILDQAKGGVKKAWEKDPWAFLERGAGAIAGVVNDQRKAAAQERYYQAALDQQNNKDRLEQEANARYSNSIVASKRAKSGKQGPLKRVSGSQIFDAQGKVVG